MNLEDLKQTNNNAITIIDSLEAPLLKLSVKPTLETVIPSDNSLTITILRSSTDETESKTYYFTLEKPLQYLNDVYDEFILEPTIQDKRVILNGKVIRRIETNAILAEPTTEYVDYESIILYEGSNYITTNYENASLEVIYPKDCEFVRLFLNNVIYGLDTKDTITSLNDIYFKDCFTKVDDKINAEFNKVTVKCFDSENQNFSMDCDGNLVVNSITTKEGSGTNGLSFDDIYPIGSIYLSVTNASPSTLFGGTWEQIKDVFLLGAGTTYSAGATGGSATNAHTHSYSHTHGVPGVSHSHNLGDNGYAKLNLASSGTFMYAKMNTGVSFAENVYMKTNGVRTSVSNDTTKGVILLGGRSEAATPGSATTNSQSTSTTGAASNTNNMPPYLAVYMWKRIA